MAGNSIPHKREGQNVLFMDFHVAFEKRPYCAVKQDNIYTYWNGSDIRQGAPPTLTSRPANKFDSLLVNDPPLNNSK
jgi:prepilin-type processing-associated H-X9-DG protein